VCFKIGIGRRKIAKSVTISKVVFMIHSAPLVAIHVPGVVGTQNFVNGTQRKKFIRIFSVVKRATRLLTMLMAQRAPRET
jgi:hypothetical protein